MGMAPYVDVWLKLNPGKEANSRGFLAGFVAHLDEACIGSISEVFDAETPTRRAIAGQGCARTERWVVAVGRLDAWFQYFLV